MSGCCEATSRDRSLSPTEVLIQLMTNYSEKTSGLSGGLEVNLYRSSKAVANEGEAFFIIILHRAQCGILSHAATVLMLAGFGSKSGSHCIVELSGSGHI